MRDAATSVGLVTSRGAGGGYLGMAVTSWASVSIDPPAVLVVVNRSATVHAAILQSNRFCLNLMAEIHGTLLEHFSRSEMRDARFRSTDWEEEPGGLPILKGALSSLVSAVEATSDYATHTIFVGRVERVVLLDNQTPDASPLIWLRGSQASLAAKTRL